MRRKEWKLLKEGRKLEMVVGKVIKSGELSGEGFFFFFFCFSLLKPTKICFGYTKMGIFYWEKTFHAGKKIGEKIRKNDFAPSEKYACYAPGGTALIVKASQTGHSVKASLWCDSS